MMTSLQKLNLQTNNRLPTTPTQQRGEGGLIGIVSMIILAVLCIKLGLAIVPAQLTDRQLDKAIAEELEKANNSKSPKATFIDSLQAQLKINGFYDVNIEDMYIIEGKVGGLSVTKDYEVGTDLFPGVAIVNTFEGEIEPGLEE